MPLLTESEAKIILEKALRFSKADECEAILSGGISGNIRTARNAVSTSGSSESSSLSVQSSFGKKTAQATINEFDDASLQKVVGRSETLAQLAPENPEYMGFLGPQEYLQTPAYFESTAGLTPEKRALAAKECLDPSREADLLAASFQRDDTRFEARLNSKGQFGYFRSTSLEFSATFRTKDGKSSGYVTRDFSDFDLLKTGEASALGVQKALLARDAKAIEPGKYTVILEPAASVDLCTYIVQALDARLADEGRSFLAKPGGGTHLGEKMVDERVTISTDPMHPLIPGVPWDDEGRARQPITWINKGVVENVSHSRYWAKKTGVKGPGNSPLPNAGTYGGFGTFEAPSGIIMSGGEATTEQMIASTKRGILVTRMWYIRMVDPQTLLFTGLTRDGTFYIEDGKLKHAIKNFRFNESPVIMLNNLEELGQQSRMNGSLIPVMKIRDFTFSSLSDAV